VKRYILIALLFFTLIASSKNSVSACTIGLTGAAAGCMNGVECVGMAIGTSGVSVGIGCCKWTASCGGSVTPTGTATNSTITCDPSDPACANATINVPFPEDRVIRSLATAIGLLYNILFPAAILFGALMTIIGGYKLMVSEGNPQKTKEAQEDLTSAILGSIFVLLAAGLLKAIITGVLGGTVSF
jgi:hypothetical protein